MANKDFNQINYQNEWLKNNYSYVNLRIPKEQAIEFKQACKTLGVSQRSILLEAVEKTIKKVRK